MSGSATFFPDNTVLINLGFIDRINLVVLLFPTRHWCLIVSRECRQSYAHNGFTSFADVKAAFGDPLLPTGAERTNTRLTRDSLAKPNDPPDKHMGEAETVVLAKNRFDTPVFLTDDTGAADLARREGIGVFNTWNVIKAAVRKQFLTEAEAWADAKTLRKNKRGWPKGVGHTYADFIAWLRA